MNNSQCADDGITRGLIISEHDATNEYEDAASRTADPSAKAIYGDIAREEKVHTGELHALLDKQDPENAEAMAEGEAEAKTIAKCNNGFLGWEPTVDESVAEMGFKEFMKKQKFQRETPRRRHPNEYAGLSRTRRSDIGGSVDWGGLTNASATPHRDTHLSHKGDLNGEVSAPDYTAEEKTRLMTSTSPAQREATMAESKKRRASEEEASEETEPTSKSVGLWTVAFAKRGKKRIGPSFSSPEAKAEAALQEYASKSSGYTGIKGGDELKGGKPNKKGAIHPWFDTSFLRENGAHSFKELIPPGYMEVDDKGEPVTGDVLSPEEAYLASKDGERGKWILVEGDTRGIFAYAPMKAALAKAMYAELSASVDEKGNRIPQYIKNDNSAVSLLTQIDPAQFGRTSGEKMTEDEAKHVVMSWAKLGQQLRDGKRIAPTLEEQDANYKAKQVADSEAQDAARREKYGQIKTDDALRGMLKEYFEGNPSKTYADGKIFDTNRDGSLRGNGFSINGLVTSLRYNMPSKGVAQPREKQTLSPEKIDRIANARLINEGIPHEDTYKEIEGNPRFAEEYSAHEDKVTREDEYTPPKKPIWLQEALASEEREEKLKEQEKLGNNPQRDELTDTINRIYRGFGGQHIEDALQTINRGEMPDAEKMKKLEDLFNTYLGPTETDVGKMSELPREQIFPDMSNKDQLKIQNRFRKELYRHHTLGDIIAGKYMRGDPEMANRSILDDSGYIKMTTPEEMRARYPDWAPRASSESERLKAALGFLADEIRSKQAPGYTATLEAGNKDGFKAGDALRQAAAEEAKKKRTEGELRQARREQKEKEKGQKIHSQTHDLSAKGLSPYYVDDKTFHNPENIPMGELKAKHTVGARPKTDEPAKGSDISSITGDTSAPVPELEATPPATGPETQEDKKEVKPMDTDQDTEPVKRSETAVEYTPFSTVLKARMEKAESERGYRGGGVPIQSGHRQVFIGEDKEVISSPMEPKIVDEKVEGSSVKKLTDIGPTIIKKSAGDIFSQDTGVEISISEPKSMRELMGH